MIVGNRVPRSYFLTSGTGESDNTVHAGSYHLALRAAGIEMCNIITYSSILPAIAAEVPAPDRQSFTHGEVMECIAAVASCTYGATATAGLIWATLVDPEAKKVHGGLVCEYSGSLEPEKVPDHLREMLTELHTNGYSHLTLANVRTRIESVTPQKMYGTALVSLCFTDYLVPVLDHSAILETVPR